jgi:hypothetical protein
VKNLGVNATLNSKQKDTFDNLKRTQPSAKSN